MEILVDSFLIFTCLMFWIMFYNKKGLLAEIKKTEQKISEKILVLEDLLDSAKEQSLVSNVESKEFFEIKETENVSEKSHPILSKVKAMFVSMVTDVESKKSESKDLEPQTVNRTLSLQDAELYETHDDEEVDEETDTEESLELSEEELEFDELELSEDESDEFDSDDDEEDEIEELDEDDTDDFDDELEEWVTSEEEEGDVDAIVSLATATSPEDEKTMLGVKSIIQEAKENLEKIDVSENIQIKNFKDVVLLAKKIDHLR